MIVVVQCCSIYYNAHWAFTTHTHCGHLHDVSLCQLLGARVVVHVVFVAGVWKQLVAVQNRLACDDDLIIYQDEQAEGRYLAAEHHVVGRHVHEILALWRALTDYLLQAGQVI